MLKTSEVLRRLVYHSYISKEVIFNSESAPFSSQQQARGLQHGPILQDTLDLPERSGGVGQYVVAHFGPL